MDINTVIEEIDNSHLMANLALKNKDFATYISVFSDDLKYKQMDGKAIDKRQLSKDTQKYFDRIKSYSGAYDRLNFLFENDLFIEKLAQKATVTIRIFLFFSKKWTVEREGIYKWKKVNNVWKISDVEIISEKLQ
jgi:hypothetical protein